MTDDDLDLRSVNWSQGMFLTPDHFLRQDRYVDSLMLWLLRYASAVQGLIGGGPRVEPSQRGAGKFDPVVEFDDSGETLKVTVSQCRGVTPGGLLIDVQPGRAINASFPKRELEGVLDVGIYVFAQPHDKEPDDTVPDPVNPQLQLGRRVRYSIRLDVRADESPTSLLLTRLRRAEKGLRFERVLNFIPPCASMSAHSGLMQAHRQLNETVASIADRYLMLHSAIVDYITMARTRGVPFDQDAETLAFVSHMVTSLEHCASQIGDPLQSPKRFFHELNQLVRTSAVFLSVSPPTREYFRQLGEVGESEFVSLLEEETEALKLGRTVAADEDLAGQVQKALEALGRLERLEQALEGRYLDYRISPTLESLNFVFDRTSGEPVLYKTAAKPARPQAQGQELTFVFAPLSLEARETYRLILVGDRQAKFGVGDKIVADVFINVGQGYGRKADDYALSGYEVNGQRNFAIDFRVPEDVVRISDLRVSVLRNTQPIRSAILYVRSRLQPTAAPPPSSPVRSPLPPRPPAPRDYEQLRRPDRPREDPRPATDPSNPRKRYIRD